MSSSSSKPTVPSMDGMTLVSVQKRTYRVPSASIAASQQTSRHATKKPGPSVQGGEGDGGDTIYTDEIVTHYHPVQRMYHGILIGKSGSTLKRLKLETGTRIDVMNGKDEVMIKGTQDKVDRAIQVIDAHLQQAIAKANLTHFVALPTQASFATRKLLDFHKEVAAYKADGINTKMLIPPQKLHITLGVCKLLSQTDLEKAILTMKQDLPPLIHSIMQNESVIAIRLKKLAIMEEDPKKASILYIEAQDETKTQVLTRLCEGIRSKLMDQGIILDEGRPLKIHITLLKTRGSGMDSDRPTFDARKLLKAHGDLDLGLVHIDKLHLMKLGPLNADGTYVSDGSITL